MSFLSIVASCCVLLTSAPADQETREIKPVRSVAYFLRHIWPNIEESRAAILPENTFVVEDAKKEYPQGSTLIRFDEKKKAIVISGPKQQVQDTATTISFFNVEPRKIRLSVHAEVVDEGVHVDSSAVVDNNKTWSFTDAGTEAQVTILPRLNEDGTVTITLKTNYRGSEQQSIMRVGDGKTLTVLSSAAGTSLELEKQKGHVAGPGTLRIRLIATTEPVSTK